MDKSEFEDGMELTDETLPWYLKSLAKLSPRLFFGYFARENKVNSKDLDYSFKLFENKKVHIQPLSGSRGFIITLDNNLTLWFYQDGDHFIYDGFEMGEYEDGDVTVLDNFKSK